MIRFLTFILVVLGFTLCLPISVQAADRVVSSQAERFALQLEPLEKILTDRDQSLDTIVDQSASKIRTYAFMLEELINIYKENEAYKPQLKALKPYVKHLEDLAGRLVDAGEHLELAKTLGHAEGSKVNQYLDGYRRALKQELVSHLKDASVSHWDQRSVEKSQGMKEAKLKAIDDQIAKRAVEQKGVAGLMGQRDAILNELAILKSDIEANPPERRPGVVPSLSWLEPKGGVLKLIKTHLNDIDWEGPNKDRKFLAQTFIDHFNYMKSHDYHQDVLQGKEGVHQLRRDLRKFSIRLSALNTNGKAVLDDDKKEPGKYSNLPNTKPAKYPIIVNHRLFVRFSDLIEQLGLAKDVKEAEEEWLTRALIHSGEFIKEAGETDAEFKNRVKKYAAEIAKKNPNFVDADRMIKDAFQQTLHGTLLNDAIKNFEVQLKWDKEDFTEEGNLTPHQKKQNLVIPNHR